jgi:hypothetical protein
MRIYEKFSSGEKRGGECICKFRRERTLPQG